MRGLGVLAGAAILLGVLSCAPVVSRSPTIFEKATASRLDPAELVQALAERGRELRSLRSLATVAYWSWEGRGSFQQVVVVDRPDRLRLETLSQLGAIVIVTVSGGEVAGFHPQEGFLYRGRSSKENLVRYTRIPLALAEVTSLLMGLPPVALLEPWEGEGNVVSWKREGALREAVLFDPELGVPVRWERFDANGEIELRAAFADFSKIASSLFPLKISFEVPGQQIRLEVRYQEPELNAALPHALFIQEIPGQVREVPLESLGG